MIALLVSKTGDYYHGICVGLTMLDITTIFREMQQTHVLTAFKVWQNKSGVEFLWEIV